MKKTFWVLSVVMLFTLAASAATTTYSFYFRDTAGTPYCDGMVLNLYGSPKALVGGYHFQYDCTNYSSVGGFKHGLPAAFQYNAIGATLDVADPAWGLQGVNRSEQWLVNTKYHTWVLYSGNDFTGNYIVNFGTWINGAKADQKGSKPASRP